MAHRSMLRDHTWLRLLGGDNAAGLPTLAPASNATQGAMTRPPPALVIGHDILGGRFAINGGALPGDLGHVAYFAPDTMAWDSLSMTHSDFLDCAFTGDTGRFYADLRRPGWEGDAEAVPLDSWQHFGTATRRMW